MFSKQKTTQTFPGRLVRRLKVFALPWLPILFFVAACCPLAISGSLPASCFSSFISVLAFCALIKSRNDFVGFFTLYRVVFCICRHLNFINQPPGYCAAPNTCRVGKVKQARGATVHQVTAWARAFVDYARLHAGDNLGDQLAKCLWIKT